MCSNDSTNKETVLTGTEGSPEAGEPHRPQSRDSVALVTISVALQVRNHLDCIVFSDVRSQNMNRRHVTGFFGVLWQAVRDGNLLGQPRSPFPSPPTQVRLSKTHRCRENFNDTATAKTRRCRENLNDAATAKHKRESTLCISGNALLLGKNTGKVIVLFVMLIQNVLVLRKVLTSCS